MFRRVSVTHDEHQSKLKPPVKPALKKLSLCCESRAFKHNKPVVFGIADGRTMADYPRMSDNTLTIASHAHAQFGFNALSS